MRFAQTGSDPRETYSPYVEGGRWVPVRAKIASFAGVLHAFLCYTEAVWRMSQSNMPDSDNCRKRADRRLMRRPTTRHRTFGVFPLLFRAHATNATRSRATPPRRRAASCAPRREESARSKRDGPCLERGWRSPPHNRKMRNAVVNTRQIARRWKRGIARWNP